MFTEICYILTILNLTLLILNFFERNEQKIKLLLAIQTIITTVSVCSILYCILIDNFNYEIVHEHSQVKQFFIYKIVSLLTNHQGSITALWWLFVYILYLVTIIPSLEIPMSKSFQYKRKMMVIAFIVWWQITTNPAFVIPPTTWCAGWYVGVGTTPTLLDIFLIIHPPIMFIGYAVIGTYAFIRDYKPLLKISFFTLTIGVTLGSWWAYNELGWGGYWFWDPVENISIIPWLIVLLSFHYFGGNSNIKQFIKFAPIYFAILGTIVIRLGLIESVHSFVSSRTNKLVEKSVCITLIVLFVIVIYLIYIATKESNALTIASLIIIFIIMSGTYITLILDCLFNINISSNLLVGQEFYKQLITPLISGMLFNLVFRKVNSLDTFIWGVSITPVLLCDFSIIGKVLLICSLKLILDSIVCYLTFFKKQYLGHLGLGIILMSMFLNRELESEVITPIKLGEKIKLQTLYGDSYLLKLCNTETYIGNNSQIFELKYQIYNKDNNHLEVLFPEKRLINNTLELNKTKVLSNITKDIYLTYLGGNSETGFFTKISVNPFMTTLWAGLIILAFSII